MKARRGKTAYKMLIHFKHNYKISAPYRVLVDGSFCNAALQNKINLREQIPKYLDAETEIVTTRCVLAELEAIGSAVHGAAVVCKQFQVDECPHKHPVAARECLIKLAKRARKDGATKYIIGTQDEVLKEKLRKLLSMPILFIAFNAVLFDKLTAEAKEAVSGEKADLDRLAELRKEILGEVEAGMKKKKKVKGKNPLSCRKKIVKPSQQLQPQASGARTAAGKRRRRKKGGQESAESEKETNTCYMPTGQKIVPDEYLALHSNEVICSLLVTPNAPHRPWLIVGTNEGDILFYPADVNHTEESRKIVRQRVHSDSPIEAIACGNLTGAFETEIVTVSADGTLTTFTPPLKEGDGPQLNYQQLIQANVRAAYVMDVDGDGHQELVIILTDRVVRTYRYSELERRLDPINKWEVPCQITGFAVGAYNPLPMTADLVLSQMGASYYISLPLSGGDKVDLIHQSESKSPSVQMLPCRTRFAGIMGSMMDNLAIRGRPGPPVVKERPLENAGFPLIGSCACVTADGLELIATVDIRGMVLIYVITRSRSTTPEGKIPTKPIARPDLKSVAFFETDESCEYMVMTAVDRDTVMISVANIFRHLFLYKINMADIHAALRNTPSH